MGLSDGFESRALRGYGYSTWTVTLPTSLAHDHRAVFIFWSKCLPEGTFTTVHQ